MKLSTALTDCEPVTEIHTVEMKLLEHLTEYLSIFHRQEHLLKCVDFAESRWC